EKFVPNPFENSKFNRLYKTGDLVCYTNIGDLQYLGRIDNQVKLRGYRIELGEIESVLETHPQVKQALVIVREEIPGNKQLVAYAVAQENSLTSKQLRELAQKKLPEYMLPSSFVILDTLPLTPNGKVDRKALPAPNREWEREREYTATHTASEEIIANIFTNVLGVGKVSIYDNFFKLGGHSLLATQLISRIRQAFEVELPLRAIFESPTVAQLGETLDQLRISHQGLSLPAITSTSDSAEQLPLSWAQERLWFLNQLEGASATYNMPFSVRISGELDINALKQALSQIIQRHSILRTSFQTVNGTPIQVIHPEVTIDINLVDLQQLELTERKTSVAQQAYSEAITPFNLEKAPLVRCTLLQLAASESVLLLTMHHIVSDGWSMAVFIQEVSALYQAFYLGKDSPLVQLPIQYADFAVWQRKWLTKEVLQNQLNYWKQQLNGAPQLLQLPTDRTRPSVQTFQGATQTFSLNPNLTQQLCCLTAQSGTTLFMTLLAAFATLLYRYSGQSEIMIGSPIANRNRNEIEYLIGFFVNTLVLRTCFEDNPSFQELITQVRETTLKAYEYQDVPFEQVVEALQPQRELSHSPLFQVMFVFQNTPMGKLELPGITLTPERVESTIAKFDLTLSMEETADSLVGSWEYNTDLFNKETIERMTSHFQNLLSAIVSNPQQKVSKLTLLSQAELHQLLVEWNDTATAYPQDKCIHQLFEEQVEKTPSSVAVVFGDEQLTYQQLNTRANQLAHHLQTLGVKPEVLVGICVERSIEMVVGLLGILKAGGAYVPLDPNYPQERLSYMLADSAVPVLLTQQSLLPSLSEYQAAVVCLDTHWRQIEQLSFDNPDVGVKSDNLAYVIYTSGSTGQPKGVEVVHRGVNRLLFGVNYLHLDAKQKFLQIAPISFDASTFEIWGALLHGGKCVLFPENIPISQNLRDEIHKHGITILWLTAALFNSIIDDDSQALSGIRQLLIGGEALSVAHVQKALEALHQIQIINGYGPTESTTFSCCHPIPGQLEMTIESISIGRPIANTQIYILDEYLQPVPVGVPGELHIGGAGLARGYLYRPELTASKFIKNPFDNSKSKRLYKTGDLARYLLDGNIEYLGRIDNQVKLRGYRIELGEIESVLETHPQVERAVVIAREEIPGNKYLVAYIVAQENSLTSSQLRELTQKKLPEYMVPSVFILLSTFPLTPNGKVDRKALPAPNGEWEREGKYVAPRTAIEQQLTKIWSEVLNVYPVGITDNFFEIGGHSLLAVRLMAQIQKHFQQNLPLATLFQSSTIEQLAIILSSSSYKKIWSPLVP
ncbi:MAG: amino acid adenylation domain-containing protein, partial [Nostoc sp.]